MKMGGMGVGKDLHLDFEGSFGGLSDVGFSMKGLMVRFYWQDRFKEDYSLYLFNIEIFCFIEGIFNFF